MYSYLDMLEFRKERSMDIPEENWNEAETSGVESVQRNQLLQTIKKGRPLLVLAAGMSNTPALPTIILASHDSVQFYMKPTFLIG
jgi:hypothetical protein